MLTLKPQIKVLFRPIEDRGDSVLLACFVVAHYFDGHREILKTLYREVTREQYDAYINGCDLNTTDELVLKIAGAEIQNEIEIIKSTFKQVSVSPFIDFSFYFSQPTRAPAR